MPLWNCPELNSLIDSNSQLREGHFNSPEGLAIWHILFCTVAERRHTIASDFSPRLPAVFQESRGATAYGKATCRRSAAFHSHNDSQPRGKTRGYRMSSLRDSPVATCNGAGKSKSVLSINERQLQFRRISVLTNRELISGLLLNCWQLYCCRCKLPVLPNCYKPASVADFNRTLLSQKLRTSGVRHHVESIRESRTAQIVADHLTMANTFDGFRL